MRPSMMLSSSLAISLVLTGCALYKTPSRIVLASKGVVIQEVAGGPNLTAEAGALTTSGFAPVSGDISGVCVKASGLGSTPDPASVEPEAATQAVERFAQGLFVTHELTKPPYHLVRITHPASSQPLNGALLLCSISTSAERTYQNLYRIEIPDKFVTELSGGRRSHLFETYKTGPVVRYAWHLWIQEGAFE